MPGRLFKILIVVVLLALAAACHRGSDEEQVRQVIAATQAAAEAGKAGDTVAALTDDFDGNGGELDKKRLEGMVRLAALRGARVGVTRGPVTVEPRGDRLVARFTVSLTSSTGLLPDEAAMYQVETAWRRDGRQWRCYSATWKR
jgi:plasmid stability protein